MATAVDPYKAYSEMYKARTDAIAAQTKQAETERAQREQAAQKTLESSNRGVYTTYKNAINPYGRMASQNNFSQGVSDYYNNASYGTMLQGLGANQYNYNDAMNNSNSLWQNYLAQKAGNEAEALKDYNTGVLAQQKYDEEMKIAEQERQEAIRQFNLQMQLKQEAEKAAQARWEAEQAENKRRYDQEWAYQMEQAAKASSGGGGGSYRYSSNPTPEEFNPSDLDYKLALAKLQDNPDYITGAGAQNPANSSTKTKSANSSAQGGTYTRNHASGSNNFYYKDYYDKNGKLVKRETVKGKMPKK